MEQGQQGKQRQYQLADSVDDLTCGPSFAVHIMAISRQRTIIDICETSGASACCDSCKLSCKTKGTDYHAQVLGNPKAESGVANLHKAYLCKKQPASAVATPSRVAY